MPVSADDVAAMRAALDAWRESGGEYDDVELDTALCYLPNSQVRVHIRRRAGRYDLTDDATAVNLAGRPDGWLATASDTVATLGMNVNRRGVVYVTGFERRDLAVLAMHLAECSRLVYQTLLESAD